MNYALAIDPGKSCGISLWSLPEDSPAEFVKGWQFSGGVMGLLRWWREHTYEFIEGPLVMGTRGQAFIGGDFPEYDSGDCFDVYSELHIVVEKFVPLSGGGFSHTLDSVEPLRCEGALIALGLVPDYGPAVPSWQRAAAQYWVGTGTKAQKRSAQKKWLKATIPEAYLTGKDLGTPDNEDFLSAQFHFIHWARKNHEPSVRAWFPQTESPGPSL